MSNMIRHIGKHGDRKVAVVFREVPGEDHMCLVIYTELLNRNMHDPIMKCIESDIGQQSEVLADALNRSYTQDGRPILALLHAEGMLKKVQTESIVMTPGPNIQIKLSELNKILDRMAEGEEAIREMAELDKQTGLQSPAAVAKHMANMPKRKPGDPIPGIDVPLAPGQQAAVQMPPVPGANQSLSDNELANSLRSQAERMAREARGLLAESERIMREASAMDGMPVPQMVTESTAATTAAITAMPSVVTANPAPAAKKAGRVKKVKVAATAS